jgi:hypothetical protein
LAFISEKAWSADGFKDTYFEYMINIFREVDADEKLVLIWTYKLEEILWTEPQYKPWSDLKEKNSAIPIFYKFFNKNVEHIEHLNLLSNSNPEITHADLSIIILFSTI